MNAGETVPIILFWQGERPMERNRKGIQDPGRRTRPGTSQERAEAQEYHSKSCHADIERGGKSISTPRNRNICRSPHRRYLIPCPPFAPSANCTFRPGELRQRDVLWVDPTVVWNYTAVRMRLTWASP